MHHLKDHCRAIGPMHANLRHIRVCVRAYCYPVCAAAAGRFFVGLPQFITLALSHCCFSHRIYITHLHGDHCFGLGAALALLDGAKARRQQDPARRRHHIYGPPGLAVSGRSAAWRAEGVPG